MCTVFHATHHISTLKPIMSTSCCARSYLVLTYLSMTGSCLFASRRAACECATLPPVCVPRPSHSRSCLSAFASYDRHLHALIRSSLYPLTCVSFLVVKMLVCRTGRFAPASTRSQTGRHTNYTRGRHRPHTVSDLQTGYKRHLDCSFCPPAPY